MLRSQTYPKSNFEIIVIDNGSSDKSVEVINKFAVNLLEERKYPNSYVARNKGLKHAKGEIIVFLDADCLPERQWLESLVEPFRDSTVGVVAGEVLSYQASNLIEGFYEFSGIYH